MNYSYLAGFIVCIILITNGAFAYTYTYPIEPDNKMIIYGETPTISCSKTACYYNFSITNNDSSEHTINISSYLTSGLRQPTIIKQINYVTRTSDTEYCSDYQQTDKDKNVWSCLKTSIRHNEWQEVETTKTLNVSQTTLDLTKGINATLTSAKSANKTNLLQTNQDTINAGETKFYQITFKPIQKTGELILTAKSDSNPTIKASLDPIYAVSAFDDFEDGDYTADPIWTFEGSGTAEVQNTTKFEGTYALKTASSAINSAEVYTAKTAYFDTNYGLYIRATDATKSNMVRVVNTTVGVGVQFAIVYDKFMYFADGDWQQVGSFVPIDNNWYYIEASYTDGASTATYTIYDPITTNVLAREVGNVRGAGTINRIIMGSGDVSHTTYFDYVGNGQFDSTVTYYNITFNVKGKNSGLNLTNFNMDCNDNTYDGNFNSPKTHSIEQGNYSCTFSRTSHDSNSNFLIQADANKSYTIYLNDPDLTPPIISVTATQRTNYTDANIVFTCTDDNSGCNKIYYQVDSNGWQINSISTGNFQTLYASSGNHTIYYIASDNADNNSLQQTSTYYVSPDLIAPTLRYSIDKNYGFGIDYNIPYSITCSGDRNDQLWFDVNIDGVVVHHKLDNNGATDYNSKVVSGTSPTFRFSCTNQSGLSTVVSVQPFQIVRFILVNEVDGVLLDTNTIDNNFLILRVFSVDGNYVYNFKTNHIGDVNAVLPSGQLVFNYGYGDASLTQINRVINTTIENTNPMRICVPLFQQFYEQQFVSYTPQSITLYNYVANCYELQGQLNYLSSSNYGLTTYTTNKPFYLYSWVNGVKTFFSLIDGGVAQAYNLDIILLTRQPTIYSAIIDGLGVVPFINPITGNADLNVLRIEYRSADGNNTASTIQIYNGSTIVYTQTFSDSNSANAFNLNWNYTAIPGITSATFFKIVVNATNPNGNKTTTRTVNVFGNAPQMDLTVGSTTFYGNMPIVLAVFALIISSLFFIFGISIASSGNTFGSFGILICLAATAICALAVEVWYVDLVIGFYLITIVFIMLVGKPKQGATFG
jgi:hypothetical protein